MVILQWGWLGEKYLIIASVLAWGLGNAAALIGKRFGHYYIEGRRSGYTNLPVSSGGCHDSVNSFVGGVIW